MKIQRYTAKDSRSAMALVRADLGVEAFILANRRVQGQVEITAALDVDEAVNSVDMTVIEESQTHSGPAQVRNELQLKTLEKELFRLRGVLEKELSGRHWSESAGQRAPDAALRNRLLRMGLSRTLAGSLLDEVPPGLRPDQGWKKAVGLLVRRLRSAQWEATETPLTAVYGGTGVGKTSTLARLAALDIVRHGPERVGLITLDSYRIGAQEQLASFAEALQIPMCIASDGRSLSQALRQLRGRRVYVDTAGMSQHDSRLRGQYELVHATQRPARHLLVLAASAQTAQCRALAGAFSPGALSGAIISKVDEAQSLGGVLDVVIDAGLPVYGFSDGQRVPEGFHQANSTELVRRAVRLVGGDKPEAARAGELQAAG